jgi:large subunit ribosomal protein L6
MSKIGKKQIQIPQGVKIYFAKNNIEIKGPVGKISLRPCNFLSIKQTEKYLLVYAKHNKAFWGLFRTLINIIIKGVKWGYKKKLVIQGVGYKVYSNPKFMIFILGYSHDIIYYVPDYVTIKCTNNLIEVFSCDKQLVGQICADIRNLKQVEVYKEKGIKYDDEIVLKKARKKK